MGLEGFRVQFLGLPELAGLSARTEVMVVAESC